jgi:hypothetical protein
VVVQDVVGVWGTCWASTGYLSRRKGANDAADVDRRIAEAKPVTPDGMDPAKVEARVRTALGGGQVNAAAVAPPVLGVRLQLDRLMTAAREQEASRQGG